MDKLLHAAYANSSFPSRVAMARAWLWWRTASSYRPSTVAWMPNPACRLYDAAFAKRPSPCDVSAVARWARLASRSPNRYARAASAVARSRDASALTADRSMRRLRRYTSLAVAESRTALQSLAAALTASICTRGSRQLRMTEWISSRVSATRTVVTEWTEARAFA